MSIAVNTNALKNVFNSIRTVSSNKTAYDFSNLCLMEFKDGKLTVSATDYEFYLKVSTNTGQSGLYSAVVNSIRFADVLANLQNEITEIKFDDRHIKITNGRSNFKFSTADVSPPEFPQMPSQKVSINGNLFKEMLKTVEHAVPKGQDSTCSGIYVKAEHETFNVFATDSYRLAVVSLKASTPSFSFTLPAKVVKILSKLNTGDSISLYHDGGSFAVLEDTENQWVLYIRLLDCPVIDYQSILNSFVSSCSFEVDKAVMLSALKPFSALEFESVDLMVNNNTVKLHASTADDEANDEIEVAGSGTADVTVNLKFLTDGFDMMNSGNVSVAVDNENKIIMIEQIKDDVELKEIIATKA